MSISSAAVGHFSHTLKYYWPSILFWMDSWPGWLTCWLCSHGRRSFPCLDSTRPKLTAFQRHQRITREQPRSPEKARDNAQRQHTNRRQPESYNNKKRKEKGERNPDGMFLCPSILDIGLSLRVGRRLTTRSTEILPPFYSTNQMNRNVMKHAKWWWRQKGCKKNGMRALKPIENLSVSFPFQTHFRLKKK